MKDLDPNFKEKVLSMCIVIPFFLLILTPHIEKGHVWIAFMTDLMVYSIARIGYKIKKGKWQW